MLSLTLIIASIYDIKTMEVPNYLQMVLLLFAILTSQLSDFIIPSIIMIVCLIFYKKIENKIGGADIKILLILTTIFGFNILYIIMISTMLAIICAVNKKNKPLPFVPFITAGVILCQILIV